MNPTGTFSGTVVKTSSSGVVLFSSLRIKTENAYEIIASCPDADSATYTNLNIVKLSTSGLIIYVPVGKPSMNFEFEVYIELTDNNDDLLSDPDGINIQLSFNDTELGIQTGITYDGTFSFYTTYHNYNYLNLIVGTVSGTIYSESQVVKNILQVDASTIVSNIQATQINQNFLFDISVVKIDLATIDSSSGYYSVDISWSPDAIFTCLSTLPQDLSGSASLTDCAFATSGEFELTFSSNFVDSVTLGPYIITNPSLSSISLTGPTKESTYIDFTIKVSLLDSSGNLLSSPSASLVITSTTTLHGSSLIVLTSTAVTDLTFYCTTTGTVTITVKNANISQSFTIEIVKNSLKFDSITPTVNFI